MCVYIYIYIKENVNQKLLKRHVEEHWLMIILGIAPCLFITVTSNWSRWRFKSPACPLFAQTFVQAMIKEKIKAPCHWLLWGESTGDRWFPSQRASDSENVNISWRHHVLRSIPMTSAFCAQVATPLSMVILPGDRFTNGVSIGIQIRWIFFRFTLTSILTQRSLQNFVHDRTAVIWWPEMESQQGEISNEFEM